MSKSYFLPDSRYSNIETSEETDDAGREVKYVRRRFIPQEESFSQTGVYEIKSSDRPDLIAHEIFKDAKAFWRACDANGVMHPEVLVKTEGDVLRVTLPEGIRGPDND
ncbi:MAG: LysM domain-containing protein [Alphaproteobacteria bacterium]